MANEIENWARAMRQTLQEDIDHLRAGGTYLSVNGGDITENRIAKLEARFEHVNKLLNEIDMPAPS